MKIQTIEFYNTLSKDPDYRILVHPIDNTDRVKRVMTPSCTYYHYDTDLYTLEEAKQQMTDRLIYEIEKDIYTLQNKVKVLKGLKYG